MNADNLVIMANQIGSFFETMPDRQQALTDIAGHIKRFWEPRMRRSLLKHVDEYAGVQLKDIVLEALRVHRASIL
ncbi:MAG TPA: formate dehydrogenase subunit delta [Rhodoferax sp.]|nr:formate dehydrogenase subunit delta [Rhodoferax sp.]HOS86086.1 formate dehydrogenase subunit delta [Burkholderiaceae bacterium]